MKVNCSVLVFMAFCLQSCAPFEKISNANKKSEIIGLYSNDCDSSSNSLRKMQQLWTIIDESYKGKQLGLIVKIQETEKNKLIAELISQDSVLSKKIIKGHFKIDECYYKRRFFYIVPILPVLWWFENKQIRIYSYRNYLALEEKYDTGGAIIIMAGGQNTNTTWFYKRLNN